MNSPARNITDLIGERQQLAARVAKLNADLQALDEQIFEAAELYAQAAQALTALGFKAPAQGAKTRQSRPTVLITPVAPMIPAPPLDFDNEQEDADQASELQLSGDSQPRRRMTPAGQAIISGTEKVLKDAGRPLKIREIFDGLTAMGVVITGKVPLNNLSAHLSRSIEFELGPKSEWWFASAEKQEPPEGGS
jgi:hypothetical protein